MTGLYPDDHAMSFLSCPLCFEFFDAPFTLQCGHTFCMLCIEDHWYKENRRGTYSCPQCAQTFITKPALSINVLLAKLVEKCAITKVPAADAAGPEDVPCDGCVRTKRKAVTSCFHCMSSFCETHLQPHFQLSDLMTHKLVAVSTLPPQSICAEHHQVITAFCQTDQQCLCMACGRSTHKGHVAVSIEAERTKKQNELDVSRQMLQQQAKAKEVELNRLHEVMQSLNRSTKAAFDMNDGFFTELIRTVELKRAEIKQKIQVQQMAIVGQVIGAIGRLDQQLVDLKRKVAEMDSLLLSDHIQFLQGYPSLSRTTVSSDESCPQFDASGLNYDNINQEVVKLREELEGLFHEQWSMGPRRAEPSAPLPEQRADLRPGKEHPMSSGPFPEHSMHSKPTVERSMSSGPFPEQSMHMNPTVERSMSSGPLPEYSMYSNPTVERSMSSGPFPEHSMQSRPQPQHPQQFMFESDHHMPSRARPEHQTLSRAQQEKSAQPIYEPEPIYLLTPTVERPMVLRSEADHLTQSQRPSQTTDWARQHFCQLNFDSNTMNQQLVLSEGTQMVVRGQSQYPGHPHRFTDVPQLLCSEGLSGRCYWEVEWSGDVDIAVSYKKIKRKGTESCFGDNAISWSLECSSAYNFRHNKAVSAVSGPRSSRIGVFLDYSAGTLLFYTTSSPGVLLHKVQTKFIQPLYPGFRVGFGSTLKLCNDR